MKLPLANIITVSRVAFFAAFIFLVADNQIYLGAAFFVVAWGLDAVDGWVARKRGEVSAFGSLLDKVVDRTMFVMTAVLLIGLGAVPPMAFWLSVKDVATAPALTIAWKAKKEYPSAGKLGRLMTVLQGLGFLWLLFKLPYPLVVVTIVGALGAYMAWFYTKELVRNN
jgi:phosphatidylglycerophosphate synthase